MKSLYDYELLVNEVFHRNWSILTYLEEHRELDPLEKECISNTIMDALVYKGLIDPTKQSLDLNHFCIVDDVEHFCYQEIPCVTGFPLWLKNHLRTKCFKCSVGSPAIFMVTKPCGIKLYCLYDSCMALTPFFPDFSLDDYIYDSPTRKGYRLTKEEARPFLEVCINGVSYLLDVLLKRMYQKDWFISTYRAVKTQERSKYGFYMNSTCKDMYLAETAEQNYFVTYLFMKAPFISQSPWNAELLYELHKSKDLFPKAWEEYELDREEMEAYFSHKPNKSV